MKYLPSAVHEDKCASITDLISHGMVKVRTGSDQNTMHNFDWAHPALWTNVILLSSILWSSNFLKLWTFVSGTNKTCRSKQGISTSSYLSRKARTYQESNFGRDKATGEFNKFHNIREQSPRPSPTTRRSDLTHVSFQSFIFHPSNALVT